MVFVTNKIFAKVWKIDKKEKFADLQISTSEKIEKDGNTSYVNSNWFARAIGKAFNQLKDISEGDRVVITKAKLSNETYEKDGKKKSALKFLILELESKDNERAAENVSDPEEDLPF